MPPKDALRIEVVGDEPTFPDAPRTPEGEVDRDKLGGAPHRARSRTTGRRYEIDPVATSPHPDDGRPVRPR